MIAVGYTGFYIIFILFAHTKALSSNLEHFYFEMCLSEMVLMSMVLPHADDKNCVNINFILKQSKKKKVYYTF